MPKTPEQIRESVVSIYAENLTDSERAEFLAAAPRWYDLIEDAATEAQTAPGFAPEGEPDEWDYAWQVDLDDGTTWTGEKNPTRYYSGVPHFLDWSEDRSSQILPTLRRVGRRKAGPWFTLSGGSTE